MPPDRPPLPHALTALLDEGLLDDRQAEVALAIRAESGRALEEILVEAGMVGGEEIARAVARRHGVPYLALGAYLVDPEVVRLVPEMLARRHRLAPVNRAGNGLTVAMVDPLDLPAGDEIGRMTGLWVKPVAASGEAIAALLDSAWAPRPDRPGDLAEA